MEENKLNVLKAKIRGYVDILKGLSEEIKNIFEPMRIHRDMIEKNTKDENPDFENVKDNISELEGLSIEMNMISEDTEKYLFKVGILYDVLAEFGETLEFEDEESNKILKLAETYSKDKEVFTFSILEGKRIVMNEDMHNEMINAINSRKSDVPTLKKLYEKAQHLLSKAQ